MEHLFDVVGENFFKPLTSQYKNVYFDCIHIIYDTYRTELSYGADREIVVLKLTDYFDMLGSEEIQLENDNETLKDSRAKAQMFLRKLREFGWIEYEFANDQSQRITMPGYAVTMTQTLLGISRKEELEYQSEVSAIYSLLTNEELLNRPYPQVLKPVHERTLSLFTGLKKLNTGIKKYIDEITADQTSEEILENFFTYHDEIGSKAYHRIKTSDNIARFRNTIISRLKNIRTSPELLELTVIGYQNVENETDYDQAKEQALYIISNIIDYFNSYDDIVKEIDKKHAKYIRNAVERAKFLLLNSNDMEGKISSVLQLLAHEFDNEVQSNLNEDVPEDICNIFNMFPQGFLSVESLKTVAISRKLADLDDIYTPLVLTDEERELRRMATYEKNKKRFSRKNISAFVQEILDGKDTVKASSLMLSSRRDMIRVIFINLYARSPKSEYMIIPEADMITSQGFSFRDFTIKRREK